MDNNLDSDEVTVENVVRVPDTSGRKIVTEIKVSDPGRKFSFAIKNGKVSSESVTLPNCHYLDNRDLIPGYQVRRKVAAIARGKRRVK